MIDGHAHLDAIDDDLDAVLARARDAGVEGVVTIGVDLRSSEWAVATAAGRDGVWATAGIHPHDADDSSPAALARIEELARLDDVVGVGETGLDYYYDNSPRSQQREVFAQHIRMAHRTGKALVIHTRDAWDDTFSILETEGVPERTVFHCWTGGPEEAARAVAIGAVLSFSGIVTFPNAGPIRDAAAATPLEHIIVETDSPFLTPVPFRGKRNEPAFVVHVAEEIGRIKDVTRSRLAMATEATTRRVFALGG